MLFYQISIVLEASRVLETSGRNVYGRSTTVHRFCETDVWCRYAWIRSTNDTLVVMMQQRGVPCGAYIRTHRQRAEHRGPQYNTQITSEALDRASTVRVYDHHAHDHEPD
jgi:hypothetical protein